tara:strand:- start:3263 stop:3802 length:540 start_codon:yes stop_codon:yes gene_type:complete
MSVREYCKRKESMKQAAKYRKYYEALDLIGCKHVSTPRQIKNGTRVFRLPFRDSYNCDIDFATYESGYVRKLVKLGYCPCYQINKKKPQSRLIKVESGQHKGYYYKLRSSERVLIPGNGDRLEYLFDYIMRNYFRAKPKYNFTIDMERLNWSAKWAHGEFGFETCDSDTQDAILKSLQQ